MDSDSHMLLTGHEVRQTLGHEAMIAPCALVEKGREPLDLAE